MSFSSLNKPTTSGYSAGAVQAGSAVRRSVDGFVTVGCPLAEEVPVAISYGGVSHAVMMATPADLEDFAIGFSRAEGIVASCDDIRAIDVRETCDGVELEITLVPPRMRAFLAERRVRALRGHTSCGLCGVEDLESVGRPPDVRAERRALRPLPPAAAVRRAADNLRETQALGRATHATHAAVWANQEGEILIVREDVGRHCALDKLVGAGMREQVDFVAGFAVITSRCSFEMVQKAAAAGMATLVAVSAPTALAVRTAEAAGVNLIASARGDSHLVFHGREDDSAHATVSGSLKG